MIIKILHLKRVPRQHSLSLLPRSWAFGICPATGVACCYYWRDRLHRSSKNYNISDGLFAYLIIPRIWLLFSKFTPSPHLLRLLLPQWNMLCGRLRVFFRCILNCLLVCCAPSQNRNFVVRLSKRYSFSTAIRRRTLLLHHFSSELRRSWDHCNDRTCSTGVLWQS